ncbi:MAG: hypothetical protein ACKOKF_02470, partial [Bacteroidota bacterium]
SPVIAEADVAFFGLLLLMVPMQWQYLFSGGYFESFVAGHDEKVNQGGFGGLCVFEEEFDGGHNVVLMCCLDCF